MEKYNKQSFFLVCYINLSDVIKFHRVLGLKIDHLNLKLLQLSLLSLFFTNLSVQIIFLIFFDKGIIILI